MDKRFYTLLLMCLAVFGSMASVSFNVSVPDGTKQCLIVGDADELGSWDPGAAAFMNKVSSTEFELTIPSLEMSDLATGFKYINGPLGCTRRKLPQEDRLLIELQLQQKIM